MMWEFSDKSGVSICDEVMTDIKYYAWLSRQGILGAAVVSLGKLFLYKEKNKNIFRK